MLDQAIVAYFDAAARRYDGRIKTFIGERELRVVRRLVPEGSIALDFGCGTGRTTLDLLRRGCRVTSYDPSAAMLRVAARRARQLGLDAEFVVDVRALAGRKWPMVTCIGVLDYYADAAPLLRQLAWHLAPGGRIVVSVPNAGSPLGWLYAAGGRIAALPVTLRTARSLERAAAQAGLATDIVHHAFPSVRPLALTILASLARPATARGHRRHGSNLSRRLPIRIRAPTARAME